MIQPQITLQSYLHSEIRHLEVTCNARYRFLDHWRTTFKRCSQSIASVRLLSPFKMSDFRTIAFVLHLEQVSDVSLPSALFNVTTDLSIACIYVCVLSRSLFTIYRDVIYNEIDRFNFPAVL